jgi:hypothetical protein
VLLAEPVLLSEKVSKAVNSCETVDVLRPRAAVEIGSLLDVCGERKLSWERAEAVDEDDVLAFVPVGVNKLVGLSCDDLESAKGSEMLTCREAVAVVLPSAPIARNLELEVSRETALNRVPVQVSDKLVC